MRYTYYLTLFPIFTLSKVLHSLSQDGRLGLLLRPDNKVATNLKSELLSTRKAHAGRPPRPIKPHCWPGNFSLLRLLLRMTRRTGPGGAATAGPRCPLVPISFAGSKFHLSGSRKGGVVSRGREASLCFHMLKPPLEFVYFWAPVSG